MNAEKKKALDEMLSGDYALLHLDSRVEGVSLPAHLMGSPMVTLKVSRLFRGVMSVNDDDVCAELLFDDSYFSCRVPYTAVFAISSERGKSTMWPESIPKEVAAQIL